MKRNIRRGFTLAEVLVTVTITAVLAAVVVPSVVNQVKKGDKGAFATEVQALSGAVTNYASDNRAMPTTFEDLVVAPTALTATWRGPYLSTGQDISTASSPFVSSAYGITYDATIPSTGCTSGQTVQIDDFNAAPVSGLATTDASFTQFYKDVTGATSVPVAPNTKGLIQYTGSGTITNLYVCLPVTPVTGS